MNTKKTAIITDIKKVYEQIIAIFFFGKPSEELTTLFHQDFMGYGTAAHEFLSSFNDLIKLTETQSAQLKTHPLTITRKPIYEKFLVNNTSYLIVEELNMHDEQNDYRFTARLSVILENFSSQWLVTHFHASTPDTNVDTDEAFPMEGLRKKNLELEAKIKERTRDLEIEVALERVRARTMAMQHSDELQEASFILDQQVRALGIKTWGCAFHIYGEKESTEWFGNEAGVLPTYTVPREGIFKDYYDKGQKGASLVIQEFSGNACTNHYEYMSSLPVIGDVLKELKKTNKGFPTYQIDHVVYFRYGYLLFITKEPVPEAHDIFKRFTKVFEQTYTRFLDLQKAEAQAREAKIETALEKVRSRTMGMQKGDELQEVAVLLYKELIALGVTNFVTCGYVEIHEDIKRQYTWVTAPGGDTLGLFYLPLTGDATFDERYAAWKRQQPIFHQTVKGKERSKHLEFAITTFNSKEAEEMVRHQFPDPTIFYCFNFSHGYLHLVGGSYLEKEEENLLARFTKVFEQTYTRFLDLQKAEAQAREAQVETSLERVRSRSMSMQNSSELLEAGELLCNEITKLGIECFTSGYVLMDESENIGWNYTPNPSTGKILDQAIGIPHKETPPMLKITASWKKRETFCVIELNRKQTIAHQTFVAERGTNFPFSAKQLVEISPKEIVVHTFNFRQGYLLIVGGKKLSQEQIQVMLRFTKVFQQTYTRFLDLQKAEAQTREAQINLAVERVRAKALSMHKSEEILDVVAKLKDEVMGLDIPDVVAATIFLKEGKDKVRMWDLSTLEKDKNGYQIPFDITFKLKKTDPYLYVKRVWENPENYFLEKQETKDLKRIIGWLKENNQAKVADEVETFINETQLKCLHHAVKKLNNGKLVIDLLGEPSDEMETILTKMGAAFDLAYKRFEDLQKAEAQAREAQIEVALERVRSRSMAMHKSEELLDVITVVSEQLIALNFKFNHVSFAHNKIDENYKFWTSAKGKTQPMRFIVPYADITIFNNLKVAQKKSLSFFTDILTNAEHKEWHNHLLKHDNRAKVFTKEDNDYIMSKGIARSIAINPNTMLILANYASIPYTASENKIIERFGKVFEQTYTRFLDLQKAEAQAKEAKIEASLEKVRTVALSLKKSDDMLEIAQVLYEQLLELGFTDIRNAIIDIHNDENETFLDYDYSHDMSSAVTEFSFYGDPVIEQQIKKVQSSNDAFFEIELKGNELEELIETRLRNGEKDDPRLHKTDHLTYNLYSFGNGAIGISNFGILSNAQKEILKRFRNVFTFAYKRYTDLANAEAQAMEAKIEASLEKVRSVALGLNKSDDMLEVAQALYEQLFALDFNNIRNSIIDIDNGDGLTFSDYDYSHEMGGTVTQMSYKDDPKLKEQLEDIMATTDGFSELILEGKQLQDLIEMRRKNGEADDPRLLNTDSLSYILYAFGKGAIGISNFGVLPDYQKSILSRFRNVFTFAYQRYTDLAQSEAQAKALLAEKQQLEKILTDLKATQAQLIQQEKLASLGQLTAGIAHEIKNPLNFVNNFSELSNELIDEVFEELKKLDDSAIKAEIKAILDDVKGNLTKVHEHGTRADSIVKSMLQHSRGGSGKIESTDLNALIKEYVNLAFHGMRAKKNPINVTIDLQLDPKIKSVSLIGEDFSRVILNLCNNAFDAMRETADTQPAKLTVRSKQEPNAIHIEVEDNGPGIPDAIQDKILQPFFTTKKGTEGTGLGLSITNDIIKAHAGTLDIESKPGRTIFKIQLSV
ncbi:MAG: ATP-binding protein [Flavobacteriaceae bacterium]